MKLNCKPGDLAIKIKANGRDYIPEGAVVRCIKISKTESVADKSGSVQSKGNLWLVEFRGDVVDPKDGMRWAAYDACLRPIEPGEGEDETLTWAGKPEKVTA